MSEVVVTNKQEDRLSSLLHTDQIKTRFEDVLGNKSPGFISSIISVANSSPALKACDPMSIISAAVMAATLDLPINPNFGFAHIVPYGNKAQFQIGWKGIVQLAMRSGQYKTINITEVYEGQIKNHNPFTGEMEFSLHTESKKIEGYLLYFKLLNGYEKYFYMTKTQCEDHGKKYSKNYSKGTWNTNFNAMALKTVAKLGLQKYGILSIDMQNAFEKDQGTTNGDSATITYEDNLLNTLPPKSEPNQMKSKIEAIVEAQIAETTEEETPI